MIECFDSVHLTLIRRAMKRSSVKFISGFKIRFKSDECFDSVYPTPIRREMKRGLVILISVIEIRV